MDINCHCWVAGKSWYKLTPSISQQPDSMMSFKLIHLTFMLSHVHYMFVYHYIYVHIHVFCNLLSQVGKHIVVCPINQTSSWYLFMNKLYSYFQIWNGYTCTSVINACYIAFFSIHILKKKTLLLTSKLEKVQHWPWRPIISRHNSICIYYSTNT